MDDAVDEVAAVHRVGTDEVAAGHSRDAVLRIGVADLVAGSSSEQTQEVL